MNVHQKGKNTIHNHQQQQQAGPPNYTNQQQPRTTAPYHPTFDDGSQKYSYAGAYVGGVGGAGPSPQVPPRLPLVPGIAGPNPSIPGAPTTSVGGMPQGPPPGGFVGHTGLDMSKQTPPHHQAAHHAMPGGPLGVSQPLAMPAAGHTGPMQGRPTQGNNQFYNRAPLRPNSMTRPPMGNTAITSAHPPNNPVMPYPGQPLTQPVVLFIGGEQYNQQHQFIQTPYQPYYQPTGNLPPGSVYPQPRATQQPYPNYRAAAPYSAPYMQSSSAVYFQPQQQAHQPQQPPQQSQQQTTPQQPPQPVAMAPVAGPGVGLQPASQTRESTSSGRRARSSAIRIVDPNTNRDVITGEEVPPPVAVASAVSSATASSVSVVPAESAVTPSTNFTSSASTADSKEVDKSVATAAVDSASTHSIEKTVPLALSAVNEIEDKKSSPIEETAAKAASSATEAPTVLHESTSDHEQVSAEKDLAPSQENGEVPVVSDTSSTSPPSNSISTSPDSTEGRGNQKGGKRRKNSRTGSTPTPTCSPPPHSIEEVKLSQSTAVTTAPASPGTLAATTSLESHAASQEKDAVNVISSAVVPPAPSPVSDSNRISTSESGSKVTQTLSIVQPEVTEEKSDVDKLSAEVSIESVITNGDKIAMREQPSLSSGTVETIGMPLSSATDDGEKSVKPTLRYSYKDDQWSPANPEGKKAYDRTFLLELQNNPASQKKPDGLPNLEVVRDKNAVIKRHIAPGDVFTPPFVKIMPPKGLPKRNSQQGNRSDQGSGGAQQQLPRREIKLMTSIARQERVEDPNVWKPKHAVKSKEDDPDKIQTDELLKAVRGILNKLTPSKFDKLLGRIQAINIDTEDRLAGVIKLFFEKAVDEPIFSSTYAKMCHALSTKEVASSSNPSETTNFRKLLLTRCQREFEKDSAGLQDAERKKKEIEESDNEEKRKILEEELEDLVNKNRRRSLGNIRFIGELFKLRILSAKIMHQCITRLLNQSDDEESLECLCRLLSTIGRELETPMAPSTTRTASTSQTKEAMNQYFSQLDAIVNKRKVSNRIRFMIQDVVDLRKNNWKPRREDNNPKTIDQIHKDVMKEREEQERELNNPQFQGPMGSLSGQRDNRSGDRRGDRGDDRNRKQSRPGDDGWSMVNNPRGGTNKVDIKQLKIPKAPGDDQGISLGPGGRGLGMWGRGASGGMSQSMMGSTPSQESRGSNRYQLLEDSDTGMHEPSKATFSGRSSLGGQPPRGGQDYRTMPGATKSALFPPNGERDRPIDSRSHPSGLGGRSRSQQSSRENSVSRPPRDTPQSLQRAVSKETLLGKATVADDEIERKAHSVLGEYFTNESIEDAALDLKEWLHPATVARFVNQCVMHVLEHNRKDRRATGTLFREMIKRKYFSITDISNGFNEVFQCAEDFIVDIPKLWEYLAELVEPLFEEGVVSFNFLGQLSSALASYATNFVAAIFRELIKSQGGVAGAQKIWMMSNASLASVLPSGVDPNEFVNQHKDIDFILKADATPRSGSLSRSGTGATPPATYNDFQRSLERFLRNPSQLTTDDVCKWIDSQHLDHHSSGFIRALVTAVTESSIDGYGTESKLNGATLKHWNEVLRRYVENLPDRELQLLFAVQALVTQRQHPKGLIQGIFETLYDSNVVSEEGFESWVSADDPAEREGKAVAMKSITSFLTWLKEADPESDQDADV